MKLTTNEQYITNFKFAVYRISDFSPRAQEFISRVYGTWCFWSTNGIILELSGDKNDVNIVADELRNEFSVEPVKVLYGERALEEAIK